MTDKILADEKPFHLRWMERQVERTEEMRRQGIKETWIQVGEL